MATYVVEVRDAQGKASKEKLKPLLQKWLVVLC